MEVKLKELSMNWKVSGDIYSIIVSVEVSRLGTEVLGGRHAKGNQNKYETVYCYDTLLL